MKETEERKINKGGAIIKMKNYKGITLIALVVTIVVSLILAGVSISMLAGENGIIKQAQDAKNETIIGEEKDKLNLAVQAAKIGSDGIQQLTEANLEAELTKNIGERNVDYKLEVSGEKFVVTYISTNHSYEIEVDGKITSNEDTTVAKKWYTEPGLDADGNKTLKVTNGEITLEIGDYIDYDPITGATELSYTSEVEKNGYGDQIFTLKRTEGETETTVSYDGEWQVIGVSDGQILIATEDVVYPTTGELISSGKIYYGLKGEKEYENAVTELDNISKLYGQGYGATGARSINVDDINKVTGYNPNNVGVYDINQTGSGTKYGEGELHEYGNEVTYYWDGTDKPYYTATNTLKGNLTGSHSTNFNWYKNGWVNSIKSTTATTSAMEEITTLNCNYYYYYPETLTINLDTTATVGLTNGCKAYNALFTDTSGNKCIYWLGTTYINTISGYVGFGGYAVVYGRVNGGDLFLSHGWSSYGGSGVRPVVTLKSDIKLTGSSEEGWKIVKE